MTEENKNEERSPGESAPVGPEDLAEAKRLQAESSAPAVPKPPVPKPPPPKNKPPAKPKGPQNEPWDDALVSAVRDRFEDGLIEAFTFLGQRQLRVKSDRITDVLAYLRRNEMEPFDFLSDETAVHWPADEEFELVYMLFSFATNGRLRVKTRIKEWESIESLVGVWPGANWLEREIYDMFGIHFTGHPDLKRILLPEDWVGFPLRKDYNLRLQDVEWVRKHLGIPSGQRFYVGAARHEE